MNTELCVYIYIYMCVCVSETSFNRSTTFFCSELVSLSELANVSMRDSALDAR